MLTLFRVQNTDDVASPIIYRNTIVYTVTMTATNGLETKNYQALAELRYQIRRFLRFSEDAARQAGLEPQHHQLMLAVKGAGDHAGPHITYLAERLQLHHHSAVELVDRLVKRGLIVRTRGDEDRREVHVHLTTRGERMLRHLTLDHREELRMAAPALIRALRKVMAATNVSPKVHRKELATAAVANRSASE